MTLEHDAAPDYIRMLLLPKDDPTAEIGQDASLRKRRQNPRKWLDQIADLANLDSLRARLARVGLVDVGVPQGRADARQQARASEDEAGVFDVLPTVGGFAARFASERALEQARHELGDRMLFIPDVYAEPAPPSRHPIDPDEDPDRRLLWPKESGIAMAHRDAVKGDNVLVGILDTGVDADHEVFRKIEIEFRYISHAIVFYDENPRDIRGFDVDGHGTHVTGLLAGDPIGVAPRSSIHVAAVIESETLRTSLMRTAYGLDWLFQQFSKRGNAHRQTVVNLSLGFDPGRIKPEDREYLDDVLPRFIQALAAHDTLMVAAAGNGALRGGAVTVPARFDEVLAVGAADWEGQRAAFSAVDAGSAKPDIYGYGVDVLSSYERDKSGRSLYRVLDGTSMAAPYVAGIAALLRCENPRASAKDVREHLLHTARTGIDGISIAAFEHWPDRKS